jgi:hypothetical protein
MRTHRFVLVPMLLALTAGCSDSTSPGPGIADEAAITVLEKEGPGAARVVLMTQNLFVGADVDAVLIALSSSDPGDDFPALLNAIQTLERTSFATRASALADRIARERPHAIGLQEVSRIEIVLPPFGLDFQLEFLPIVLDALADRGLDYEVAAQVLNIDANPTPGIRLVDYDVLLVDAERVTVNSASGQNFTLNVGPFAPGVSLIRGWVQADVTIGGHDYTIVSTHTEPDLATFSFEQLRAAQIGEIVTALGGTNPVIIMGDLNDQPGTLMYQVLTGAGFTDVWSELRPGVVGLTCCHETDLSDKLPALDERVDYLFARGFAHGNKDVLGRITRFGMLPSDRVAGPLGSIWVSDHAGLLATLLRPADPH